MRICTTILTIVLSMMFASNIPAAQRGIKVSAQTPTGKSIPLYSGSYALVIGNGDYTNGWDPLPGAMRDVKDVARALKENGFNVTLKTNVTRNAFRQAFGRFFHKYGRNKTNRLFFYYAGHGYTQKMYTGEDQGYLVMVDAPAPEKDPVGFDIASIDMQVVVTQAKKVKARHVLFMFDSCFSGAILNLRERVVPEAISDSVSLPVRQFITAGRANEPVPDHSIFKQAFLDLLEGRDKEPIPDGYITGEELGLYLKNRVPEYNASQHPQYGKIKDIRLDKGDFVFALKGSPAGQVLIMNQPSGIKDYDRIIYEREADKRKWDPWQKRMATDLARAERYDNSSALKPEEKSEVWKSFLVSYSKNNPYTDEDDIFREKAKERSQFWFSEEESVQRIHRNFKMGNEDAALKDLEVLLTGENRSQAVLLLHELFEILAPRKDYRTIIDIMKKGVTVDPKNIVLREYLIFAYLKTGKETLAISELEKLLEQKPDDMTNWLQLARLSEKKNQMGRALRAYGRVVELSPRHPEASKAYLALRLGLSSIDKDLNGRKGKGKLFVDTAPTGARIRILNINPKFYQGMKLKPGRYHVEASKQGYETQKMWVELGTGEDKKLEVNLEQMQASIQPTTNHTRQTSSTSGVIKRDGVYVAYSNGIVKDTNTGLEWKAGPDRNTDWNEARTWVKSLNLDGGGGWRMPTMDELEGLYNKGMGPHNITPLLKATSNKYLWVWSGETRGSSDARVFVFYRGNRYWDNRGNSNFYRAFAVRSRGDG